MCIRDRLYPYHAYVPSFGDWGFLLASSHEIQPENFQSDLSCRYLDSTVVEKMFYFEKDIDNPGNLSVNRLDQPVLLTYFLEDWEKWRKDKKQ